MDPITAFAAVQATVKMIKQASAAANDVASLGPLIGKYFDTKHQATKAVRESKKAGGSNMGKAIEIELALKSQADFEKELKDLFFASGNMDIWKNIMQRVAEMNAEDKAEEERERVRIKNAKKRQKELMELFLGIGLALVCSIFIIWGVIELISYCMAHGCGRR